jgi:hypothetical protein
MLVTIQFLTLIILVTAILYNIFPTIQGFFPNREGFSCVDDLNITKLNIDANKDEYHTDIIKSSNNFNINNIYKKCTDNPTEDAKELITTTDSKYASIDGVVRYKGGTTRNGLQDIGTYDCLIDSDDELGVFTTSIDSCADECDKREWCKGFKYNKKNKMCITTMGTEINKIPIKVTKMLEDYCVTFDKAKDSYDKNNKSKKQCGSGKNEMWIEDGGDWKKKYGKDVPADRDKACKEYCSRYEYDVQDTMTFPDGNSCKRHTYNKKGVCFNEDTMKKNKKNKADCKGTNIWMDSESCFLDINASVVPSKESDKVYSSYCKNKLYTYAKDDKINDKWKDEGEFIYYPKNEQCFDSDKLLPSVCYNPCYSLTTNEFIRCNDAAGYHITT